MGCGASSKKPKSNLDTLMMILKDSDKQFKKLIDKIMDKRAKCDSGFISIPADLEGKDAYQNSGNEVKFTKQLFILSELRSHAKHLRSNKRDFEQSPLSADILSHAHCLIF